MNTQTIDMMTVVTHGNEHVATEIDSRVVMMSVEQGKYYGLDSVGSRTWNLLEQPRRVTDVCAIIQDEFAVDRETCERDILKFINQLVAANLLRVVDEGIV